jgi:hypothetical protein
LYGRYIKNHELSGGMRQAKIARVAIPTGLGVNTCSFSVTIVIPKIETKGVFHRKADY